MFEECQERWSARRHKNFPTVRSDVTCDQSLPWTFATRRCLHTASA